jgi:hypothetical protein
VAASGRPAGVGRAYEVELANVEAALGIGFSPEQLAAAGITIHSEHEEAA